MPKDGERSKKAGSSKGPDHSAPVYHVDHDLQVDLLAQALLREYMHKKNYKATLQVFDEECPRDGNTVSSRAIMYDLMHLEATMAKYPELKDLGLDTVMQILCFQRVNKRLTHTEIERIEQMLAKPMDVLELPPEPEPEQQLGKDEAAAAAERKKKKKEKREKKEKKKEKKEKKDKKEKQRLLSIDELLDKEDDLESVRAQQQQQYGSSGGATAVDAMAAVLGLGTRAEDGASKLSKQDRKPAPKKPDEGSSEEEVEELNEYDRALRELKEQQHQQQQQQHKHQNKHLAASAGSPGGAVTKRGGWDTVDSSPEQRRGDSGSDSSSASDSDSDAAGGGAGTPSYAAPSSDALDPALAAVPHRDGKLTIEEVERLRSVMCGARKIPHSFLAQGFSINKEWSKHSGLHGLEQHRGGPCGVLAALQGFMAREHFGESSPSSLSNGEKTAPELVAAAMKSILLGINRDVVKLAIVDPELVQNEALRSLIPSAKKISGFTSREQVKFLRSVIFVKTIDCSTPFGVTELKCTLLHHLEEDGDWSEPESLGMLLFFISAILTRGGPDAVAGDFDFAEGTSLIVEHGYCAQESVNLLLSGRATSNLHNGETDVGGRTLRGIGKPLSVGFATILEHKGYVEVGSNAKQPTTGVWLIYNESHYTVMYAHPGHYPAESAATFDVHYYDQQGGQDEDIRLTVDRNGSAGVKEVVVDGTIVPYMNDIIRTVFGKACKVDWNGSEPLL